jgi:hypothetical protein
MKRPCRIGTACEKVEYQGNIDGEHSQFLGVFEFVSVINVIVEISRLRSPVNFNLRLGV